MKIKYYVTLYELFTPMPSSINHAHVYWKACEVRKLLKAKNLNGAKFEAQKVFEQNRKSELKSLKNRFSAEKIESLTNSFPKTTSLFEEHIHRI